MTIKTLMLILAALSLMLGCDDGGGDGDGDVDGDVDSDSDVDGDSDADADTDADADSDADTDADTDADADADADGDADGDSGGPSCDGAPGGEPVSDSPAAMRERVAWTGTNIGVSWVTPGTPVGSSEVFFSMLGGDLSTVADDHTVADTGMTADTPYIDLQWDGSALHLVWAEGSGDEVGPVRHQAFDGVGALSGTITDLSAGDGPTSWPALAVGDSDLMAIWTDDRTGNHDVYARRLDGTGATGSEIAVATGSSAQWLADVAYRDGQYWIVYLDQEPPTGFYIVSMGASGPSAPVSVLDGADPAAAPTLIPTAGGFLLLWRTVDGLDAAANLLALGADGAAAGTPVVLDDEARSFAAAHDGTDLVLFVVHSDFSTAEGFLRRFNGSGGPLGAPALLACAENVSSPAIAWTGTDFIVAWTEPDPDPYFPSRLFVQRMTY